MIYTAVLKLYKSACLSEAFWSNFSCFRVGPSIFSVAYIGLALVTGMSLAAVITFCGLQLLLVLWPVSCFL